MLSRNILIASVVVFLATTISTAPVEEKEPEEIEVEDGEEELSEEEEDDDDSKSQEKNMGIGAQQATTISKGLGISAQPGTSFQGEAPNGHKLNGDSAMQAGPDRNGGGGGGDGGGGGGGGDAHTSPFDPSSHGPSLDPSQTGAGVQGSSVSHVQAPGKVVVHPGTGVVHSDTISHGSMGQAGGSSTLIIIHETHPQPAGGSIHTFDAAGLQTEAPTSETEIESPEYDTPESPEFNGNGHKLLIGGAVENGHAVIPVVTDLFIEDTTHMDPTGAMDPLGASSHLDNTGIIDQSSHDFLIGLMGGVGDPYGPDIHIDISDHTGITSPLDSIAVGSDPGPASSSSSSPDPDVPPGLVDHIGLISDFTGTTDYSGLDHPYLSSGFDGSYHSVGDHAALSDTTDHPVAVMSHTDYSSSQIDHPGNGRQSQVTDTHGGDHPVNDMHHDVTDPSGQQIVATDVGLLDAGEHGVVSHHNDMGAVTDGVAVQHHDDAHTVGPQTDTTGAAEELVTSSHTHIDITAVGANVYSSSAPGTAGLDEVAVTSGPFNSTDSVLGFGHDTTVVAEAHSVFIQTDSPVTADPQGSTLQASSHPGVTEQTPPAVSAAEQYNPSGQGPEGAENVELEDTC